MTVYVVTRDEQAPDPRNGRPLRVWAGQKLDTDRPEGAILATIFSAVVVEEKRPA